MEFLIWARSFWVGYLRASGACMRFFQGRVIAAVTAAAFALGVCTTAQANEIDDAILNTSLLNTSLLTTAHVYHLRLHQLHTNENIDVVYRVGSMYIPTALGQLNQFLRDYRSDDVKEYDPREFDTLHALMTKLGKPNGVIDIVCGYRTPRTNAMLRHASAESGVAEHSQHMEGHAIDIRVPGVATKKLRDTALSLDAGGVGYYPKSQFVHVDVGPVREWSFGASKRRPRMMRASYSRHRHGRRGVIRQMGN
jgi:uncharacterized protein YcbK (DUF882 family)